MIAMPKRPTYDHVAIQAAQQTRSGRLLKPLRLDADARDRLVRDQMGLFISGVPNYEAMLRRVVSLSRYRGGRWIAIPATNLLAATAQRLLGGTEQKPRHRSNAWHLRLQALELTTLEHLPRLDAVGVEGVILLDPCGFVHQARGCKTHFGKQHDRPQRLVDFVAKAAIDSPPGPVFAVMTTRPAIAQPTMRMAEVYRLAGWQFLDGIAIRFGGDVHPESESR